MLHSSFLRRILSIILTALILSAFIPSRAYSMDGETFDDGILNYVILNDYEQTAGVSSPAVKGLKGSVTVPETVTYKGREFRVVSLEDFCFSGADISEIILPDTISHLGEEIFAQCSLLESANIPASAREVPVSAFENCTSLQTVTIPAYSVMTVRERAFFGCTSLKTAYIPDGVYSLEEFCFAESGIASVRLPETLTTLETGVFSGCESLKSVRIPSQTEIIPQRAFSGCTALESVEFADGIILAVIDEGAFKYCESLKNIDIPDSVYGISGEAFMYCSALERLEIPYKVQTLYPDTFSGCESMKEIILPAELSSVIDGSFFSGCVSLESISISQKNKIYRTEDGVLYGELDFSQMTSDPDSILFGRSGVLSLIRYPAAKKGSYTVQKGTEVIFYSAFSETVYLTSLTIPESVIYFESRVFFYSAPMDIIFLSRTPPVFSYNTFMQVSCSLYVPDPKSVPLYKNAVSDYKPGGRVSIESLSGNGQKEENPNPGSSGSSVPVINSGTDNPDISGPDSTDPGISSYFSSQATSDFRSLLSSLEAALSEAQAEGSSSAFLQLLNYRSLDLETMKQLAARAGGSDKLLIINADTVRSGSLQVSLMFRPADAQKPLLLSGSVDSKRVQEIRDLVKEYFGRNAAVIELAQQYSFGMRVTVAAKVSLEGLDTSSLYFYSYNSEKNTFTQIVTTFVIADENGYVWFSTRLGGDIIITDSPLQ